MIRTIRFTEGAVELLDQNQLPDKVAYHKCLTPEEVADAIRTLKVRGAPLIGVTAAFGLVLAIKNYKGKPAGLDNYFNQTRELLAATRPTAVNLFWALARMNQVYRLNQELQKEDLVRVLEREAQKIYTEDISINQAIGNHGQEILAKNSRVMTICNAGALATCGYGTALGVIRSAVRENKIENIWACETRPVLQGARLTVWELSQDKIPVTLITDSMAGYVMKLQMVDAVIVGADRIAANGDTANKIGTYALAVLAHHHHIPFYVAAPLSTIDYQINNGNEIPIEERDAQEIRQLRGQQLTLPDVKVFNPAFDVTPARLITAIITEKGIVRPPFDEGLEALKGEI